MTEKAVNIVSTIVITSDLFRAEMLSNPPDLKKLLTTAASELDDEDLGELILAVAGCGGDARRFFKKVDQYRERRYPTHPKPPWAV